MIPVIFKTESQLQARVHELAIEIQKNCCDRELVVICLLKGGFIFFSDFIRHLTCPMTCEFLGISSYQRKELSSGEVKITLDIHEPLKDRDVVVLSTLVETGLTLNYILEALRARQPRSLKSCALLLKKHALQIPIILDYVGFEVPENDEEQKMVGYGMDFQGQFRGLPYVGFLGGAYDS